MIRSRLTVHSSSLAATVLVASVVAGTVARAQEPWPAFLKSNAAGLEAVPLPRLDDIEPAVAEQLREERRRFEQVAAGSSRKDLDEAFGSLAQIFHAYEFFDSAEAAYLNATRLSPNDPRWLHLLGYLYQQTGRLEDAAARFEAARRVRPDDHATTVRLGEVYLGLNRLRDARAAFQDVAAIFPAVAQNGLGEVDLRERRFDDAVAHFKAALERVPQATSLNYSLAMAYRGLGRLEEARYHLQRRGPGGLRAADPIVDRLQTLVRGERALVLQGRRAYEAGQFRDAADAFRKAVIAAPESATSRVNLGLALSQLGDSKGAQQQFEQAVRLQPDNVAAHAGLGALLARQGRDVEAVDHFRTAFATSPEDVGIRRELLRSLVKLGRDDDAIALLTKIRGADADDEETVLNLSILLAGRSRYGEAVTLLDEAYRRFPDRIATATTLARLLASSPDRSLRDGRRALDVATAVYTSSPTPVHGETVALALAELERCAEASEWMRKAVSEAERAKDAAETARLRGELPKYLAAMCRPAGK